MPRIRSLLTRTATWTRPSTLTTAEAIADTASSAGKSDSMSSNGGNWYHRYCLDCAREIIRRDIDTLEALARELDP